MNYASICSVFVLSRKLVVVAAAAAFQPNTSGWWNPRAYQHCTTFSRKRYIYRNFASNDDDTTFSVASTSQANIKSYYLRVKSPEEMETVGGILSHVSTPGDVILLEGALGVGKTCWARGFIRTLLGNEQARVTSPTYLLSNSYKATILVEDEDGKTEEEIISIHHMDLYRLSGKDPTELQPLALDHAFNSCISLIEWPDRLGTLLEERIEKHDQNVLCVNLYYYHDKKVMDDDSSNSGNPNMRIVELIPRGHCWKERLPSLIDDAGGLKSFFIK